MRLVVAIILLLLLSACAGRQNLSFNHKDTVASFYCQRAHTGKSELLTSSGLYQEMHICLLKKEYESAVRLFSLAGSLSWYQAANNGEDRFKQKEGQLLRTYLEGIPKDNIDQFWRKTHQILGTYDRREQLCAQLRPIGTWIQKQYPDAQAIGWQQALTAYLYCQSSALG